MEMGFETWEVPSGGLQFGRLGRAASDAKDVLWRMVGGRFFIDGASKKERGLKRELSLKRRGRCDGPLSRGSRFQVGQEKTGMGKTPKRGGNGKREHWAAKSA